ncbi:MAG: hypothetical protein UY13_C0002G0283 [Candidatus Pacebacteria bacterium GW2011_GWB1_47_8]|nr:MAG: hypothetical protein UX28_C0001G0431 [Candidatus Pacebacteria bacterium GW2011_GWA1_46_10]KKU84371.1 MAG: hypothetical protein UY13_C0002G0283 [Candidatus Pacebacteria bacterium GW2011_GWB1_47_8]
MGLIIILAVFVRFYQLGQVPIELTRDEASLGFTAFSLLETGREEHGTFWPVQIESFGDWKLPLYVYTLIPFIKLFGLTMWSVRLPSALAGVSIVVSSFYLVSLLTQDKKYRLWLKLGVPLLLAVSPWAVHFGHVAYEAHLSLAVFLWGLVGVLTVIRDFEAHQQRRLGRLISSLCLWSLTLLGYHAYQVFVPLLVVFVGWVYWSTWRRFFGVKRRLLFGVAAPFVIVGLLLLGSGAQGANQVKFSGLSIFSLEAYTKVVDSARKAFSDPSNPFFVLAANKVGAFFEQVQTNFFRLISPEFLFLQGGANHGHNITGFGNFYPLIFFGLVVGIASIIIERKQWLYLLGSWVVAASVAPMITFEANHTTRFSPGFVVLEILSVYGWVKIIKTVRKTLGKVWLMLFLSALTLGLSYSVYRFLIHYYFVFPVRDAQYWLWQIKPIVYFVNEVKADYDAVYIQDEKYSPYTYFLFYEPGNPAQLSQRIEYYPADFEGFRHVRRLDNIYFQTINWDDQLLYADQKVLFVVEENKMPEHLSSRSTTKLLMTLKHEWVPKGVEVWEYQGLSLEK